MEELPRPAAFLPETPPKLESTGRSISGSSTGSNGNSTGRTITAVAASSSTRTSPPTTSSTSSDPQLGQGAVVAAQQGNLGELKILVESGAVSVAWKDPKAGGCSLLHWAAINGRMGVVHYLMTKHADINAVGGALQETTLQWAARQGHLEAMCALTRYGVDIHHKNTEGADAFFICAMAEFRPGVMYLATQGAKVNSSNNEGLTPLLAVCKHRGNNLALLRTLLALGCDANCRDLEGNSAIHLAIKGGGDAMAIARVLMRYGTETKLSSSSLSYQRGYHAKESLSGALSRNAEGKDPIHLCRSLGSGAQRQHDIAAKYLSKLKHVHMVPAPIFYLVPAFLIAFSVLAARFLGLLAVGVLVVVGATVIQRYKGALTPRQEDCLGVGITTTLILLLVGEYMYHLQGEGADWLDLIMTIVVFAIVVLAAKVMLSDPGTVNGSTQSPYDVLDTIFDEKNFGPTAPAAAGLAPAWESRKRCESCFAKRLPRVKHCNACEACVHRFDHHCHYIANCVGSGNHRLFMGLVVTSIMGLALWIYATVRVILHASSLEWEAIFHGDKRDLLASLVVATMCLTWLLILSALQIALIGWDITSYEIFRQRRASTASSSGGSPRTGITAKQFMTNLTNFFIHPSQPDDHRDNQLLPDPIERRASSYDGSKWCNAV